jgi:hypothetical protein
MDADRSDQFSDAMWTRNHSIAHNQTMKPTYNPMFAEELRLASQQGDDAQPTERDDMLQRSQDRSSRLGKLDPHLTETPVFGEMTYGKTERGLADSSIPMWKTSQLNINSSLEYRSSRLDQRDDNQREMEKERELMKKNRKNNTTFIARSRSSF